jgi:hypothetical protein
MPQDLNLGKWIKEKYGSQAQFAQEIGADPTLVSRWINGAGISETYQKKIRDLKFKGPFPEPKKEITLADLESLREEIRAQAAWVRVELQKENKALAADLEKVLAELAELRDNPRRATS